LSQLAKHVEAVHVGQHHVEKHQVRTVAAGGVDRIHPGGRRRHREARVAQAGGEQLDDVRLVVDHQQFCLDGPAVLPGPCFTIVHGARSLRQS
jgi:hypothetical protein